MSTKSMHAIRTIASLETLTCSKNGNPRYRVTFTDGTAATTQSDANFCYGIGNRTMRDVELCVEFTKAGLIADMRPKER